MPVVVWSQAAIADFVLQNRVGIMVESLHELETAISQISVDEYQDLCENVDRLSEKLHDGYFFKEAVRQALDIVS